MGVFDLEGTEIPDNKGGRPPKEETEDESEQAYGNPYTQEKDSEEWWLEILEEVGHAEDSLPDEFEKITDVIMDVSDHTHTNIFLVREKLEEYGIYETDWEEYHSETHEYSQDLRCGANPTPPQKDGSSGFLDGVDTDESDEEDEPSTGLKSLIDG